MTTKMKTNTWMTHDVAQLLKMDPGRGDFFSEDDLTAWHDARSAIERFWLHVDFFGADGKKGCWTWTGHRNRNGYGQFHVGGRKEYAHRVACALYVGPIPDGLCVCHECDNPACTNPAHLFVDSVAGNNHDMVRKGRQARGDQHGARLHPERLARGDQHGARLHPERLARGERNGNAKLAAADVVEIRRARAAGALLRELAVRFGVSQRQIRRVVNGKRWRHVA